MSFALVFSCTYCWVLIFVCLLLDLDLYVLGDDALISWCGGGGGAFMQTKHLWVLIHIWTKGEVGAVKPSKIFLLTFPRRHFFCWSFMLFLSCVCYAFVRICLLMPCGHLLEQDWLLGSRLWCLLLSLLLSHWYHGSGMVLEYIDSWSLPSFLFCRQDAHLRYTLLLVILYRQRGANSNVLGAFCKEVFNECRKSTS